MQLKPRAVRRRRRREPLLKRIPQARETYEAAPDALLVLASQTTTLWPLAVVAVVAIVIGWPLSLYALPFAVALGLVWLGAPFWRGLDQPSVFVVERERLVLIHRGFRAAARRTCIPLSDIVVVWDLGDQIIVEFHNGRTCSIAFGARARRDSRARAVYRVLENRTGIELGEHEPDAIRTWADAVLQVFARQGVVTREFPSKWRTHFWGGIARRGSVPPPKKLNPDP